MRRDTDPVRHRGDDKLAGIALLVGAAANVFLMLHHPTNAQAQALPPTHAALLVIYCLTAAGLLHFCIARGLSRFAMTAGLIAYLVSFFGNVGAGLINGLITPRLLTQGEEVASIDVLAFAWAANQTLAAMAIIAGGVALVLWGADLVRDRSVQSRMLGLAGIVLGTLPAALLMSSVIEMDVPGATLSYGFHAGWAGLVGLSLILRRVKPVEGALPERRPAPGS